MMGMGEDMTTQRVEGRWEGQEACWGLAEEAACLMQTAVHGLPSGCVLLCPPPLPGTSWGRTTGVHSCA